MREGWRTRIQTRWLGRFGIAPLLVGIIVAGNPEVIDRIAVSVGYQAITESEIELAIRITSFINGDKPDLSPQSRRKAAERLADQMLIRNEMKLSRYPMPPRDEARPEIEELARNRFGNNRAAFEKALQDYKITRDDLLDYFWWQSTFLRFVDVRFRPGVQVTDEEMRDYFEHHILPLAKKANPGQPVTFEEYRDRIEQTLVGQRVDQEIERWLERARRRTQIVFREEAFK